MLAQDPQLLQRSRLDFGDSGDQALKKTTGETLE